MDVKCEPGSIKIDIKMVRIALRQKKKESMRPEPNGFYFFMIEWGILN